MHVRAHARIDYLAAMLASPPPPLPPPLARARTLFFFATCRFLFICVCPYFCFSFFLPLPLLLSLPLPHTCDTDELELLLLVTLLLVTHADSKDSYLGVLFGLGSILLLMEPSAASHPELAALKALAQVVFERMFDKLKVRVLARAYNDDDDDVSMGSAFLMDGRKSGSFLSLLLGVRFYYYFGGVKTKSARTPTPTPHSHAHVKG